MDKLLVKINKISWVALSQYTVLVIQMATVLILSHFIYPEDFGRFALFMTLVNFISILKDIGTTNGIIKKDIITKDDINAAHSLNIFSGLVGGILVLFLIPFIMVAYKNDDVLIQLLCLSLIIPISCMGLAKAALFQKELRFKEIAYIEISASVIAALTAIVLAILGVKIYALLAQLFISTLVTVVGYSILPSNQAPKLSINLNNINQILKGGSHITAFNFIHYLTRNLDVILIGKIFGEYWVGLYSLGLRFVMLPYQVIISVINKFFFPMLLADEKKEILIQSFIIISRFTITVSYAMISFLVLFSSDIFSMFMGSKWLGLEAIIIPMAFSGLIAAIIGPCNMYLIIKNSEKQLMQLGFYQMIITIVVILTSGKLNFPSVMYLMLISNAAIGSIFMINTCSQLKIEFNDYLKKTRSTLMQATLFLISVLLVKKLYIRTELVSVIILIIGLWFSLLKPSIKEFRLLIALFNSNSLKQVNP